MDAEGLVAYVPGMMTTSGISGIYRAALVEHAKLALIEVVNREPDTTLEDLARLVAINPELGGLTLDELLMGLRARHQQEPRPPVLTTDRAAERIAGYEAEVRELCEHGLEAARELGLLVRAIRIRARLPAGDEGPLAGVFIDFRIPAEAEAEARRRFWDRIHEQDIALPFEVSLAVS